MITTPRSIHWFVSRALHASLLRTLCLVAMLASALPAMAAGAGLTAALVVGSVKVQRPGTDGSPGAFQLIMDMLRHEPKSIADGAALHDLDGLRGEDDGSAVQLVCSNGATLALSGKFDAFLRLGAGDEGCTVYLRSGTAVATTGTDEASQIPTVIQYGDVTLGARSTQFGATVTSPAGKKKVEADAFVIEGVVDVQHAAAQVITLRTGDQLLANAASVSKIADARFDSVATTYAKLGAKSAPEPQRAAVQQELQAAFAQSLRKPDDMAAQRALVQVYQTRRLQVSPAVKYRSYQLDRVSPAAIALPQSSVAK